MNRYATPYNAAKRPLYCPACRVELQTTHRLQVEIEYCPFCQAVWLQRGELNTIVERHTAAVVHRSAEAAESEADDNSAAAGRPSGTAADTWFDFG